MDTEARKIARHHLGDRLHWIGRGGPTADEWIVQAWPDTGHMIHAQAPTVDAAAADCAAQLRAAGWVPSHARLEWERKEASLSLALCVGSARIPIADILHVFGKVKLFLHTQVWRRRNTTDEAEAVAIISEWCAANLPYHLPDFPGASDAS